MLHYPVLLVHGFGVFSQNLEESQQWGRIPDALHAAGTSAWFSTQDGYGSVKSNAHYLADELRLACCRAGSDKMHVVAHSKGGLDVRRALMCEEDVVPHVASFVTLSSPHKGMHFVDALMRSRVFIPYVIAPSANARAHRSGDKNSTFMLSLNDLRTDEVRRFVERYPDQDSVVPTFSFGFTPPPAHGRYRSNFIRSGVSHYDGENDGLVPLWSTEFGNWKVVRVVCDCNFKHIDSTDLYRKDARFVMPDGRVFSTIAELIIDVLEGVERSEV